MVPFLAGVLVCVLVAAPAAAQPHVRRDRSATITGNPDEALPEIRAAPGVQTLLLFDAAIRPEGLAVDRSRVKILGAGESFLLLELVVALDMQERVILQVPYAEGRAPAQAVFSIVSHPTEVNPRMEVERREQPVEACQAELTALRARCATLSPTRFVRAGLLGPQGVKVRPVEACEKGTPSAGLRCTRGTLYLADAWALLELELHNAEDQPPWRLLEAALWTKWGTKSTPERSVVEVESLEIEPGETGRVHVETGPPERSRRGITVEFMGTGGRTFTLPNVYLTEIQEKP